VTIAGADGPLVLRAAVASELPALSALCLRSKASWGYDAQFLARCVPELTLSPEDLTSGAVYTALRGTVHVGVAHVVFCGSVAELDKLFVEPSAMQTGVGRRLLVSAMETARQAGASELMIVADPGAVPFYHALGAKAAGLQPPASPEGRALPRLVLELV